MRRAAAAAVLLALAAVAPARAADDYPVCTGDTSAAGVPQKPGAALRVGITPRVQAGQVGPVPAQAVSEDPAKTLAALALLRPSGGPLVVRLNRFFWSDGEAGIQRFLEPTPQRLAFEQHRMPRAPRLEPHDADGSVPVAVAPRVTLGLAQRPEPSHPCTLGAAPDGNHVRSRGAIVKPWPRS